MQHDSPVLYWLRGHPYIVFLWITFMILGPIVGVLFLRDAYGLEFSVLAGVVGGAGCAMIVTVNRILEG